jgi:chitinase
LHRGRHETRLGGMKARWRWVVVAAGMAVSTAWAEPRLVTYYNGGDGPFLASSADFDYTHVIVAFLLPDPENNALGFDAIATTFYGTTITTGIAQGIRNLQENDKKVMLAFGGATVSTEQYAALSLDVPSLAASISNFVKNPVTEDGLPLSFDGIDIDWEDTFSFIDPVGAGYNGVEFLTNLTLELRKPGNLPRSEGFLLTHAPQPPYLSSDPNQSGGGIGGYIPVLNNAAVSDAIDWINMQYYNNPAFNTAAAALENYQDIVNGWSGIPGVPDFVGLDSGKLLVGKPVAPWDAGSGWMPAADFADEIVSPLVTIYGEDFGGAFGWQLASDTTGAWGATIHEALAPVPEPHCIPLMLGGLCLLIGMRAARLSPERLGL